MLSRTLTRRDAGPEHWTERGVDGGDISVDALTQEPGEMRHLPFGQKRVDHLPVGRVPADQQEPFHAAGRVLRHRRSPTAPRASAANPVETALPGSGVPTPAPRTAPV